MERRPGPEAAGDDHYEAEIRRTTHGVAHVRAAGWGSLGFGQGFACARDHLPTIADQVVKVRGERSRFHGPGPDGAHLAGDFGYRALDLVGRAAHLRDAQPAWIRELVDGYAAGYNAWLAEARGAGSLPAWCAEARWIRPLSALDLYTYLGDVALLGSGRNLVGLIGRAEAPGPDGPVPPSPAGGLGTAPAASNGWAFGGEVTDGGHGLVVANPHFPWYGEARFWECHLTIPGVLDVYGVSLLGVPGVQIGFNRHVAWTHTFSRGHRFTVYALDLVDGEPTRYRYGDTVRAMEPTTYSVEVAAGEPAGAAGDPGGLVTVERTLWSSHHGPILNLPVLGWGLDTAYSYRDANLSNTGVLELFLRTDRAGSVDDVKRVYAEVDAMAWVNTLAADTTGQAWYIDGSATPNLSAAAQERFTTRVHDDLVAALLLQNRIALLDGSDPGDEWVEEPGAREPGLVPFARLPQLDRRDYVVNANDSHWLSHPDARLEGYSVLHGFERTPRSMRTRHALRAAAELVANGPVTAGAALAMVFSNVSLSAAMLRDDVVRRCREAGAVEVDGRTADLGVVAEVLARWDGRCDLDSTGVALWREMMASLPEGAWLDAGPLWARSFDPADPVATPAGLAPAPEGADDPVAAAAARAVFALEAAGVAIGAPLRAVQWAARGTERVPVHGGGEGEGVLNVLAPVGSLPSASLDPVPGTPPPVDGRAPRTGLAEGGYQVSYGTSFVMAVEMRPAGPRGLGVLAYGQAGDSLSPHHHDGTGAFAAKSTRALLFTDAEIDADPDLVRRVVTAPRPAPAGRPEG